ncbi:hypothetical protein [Streptomyces sp. NPDC059564]|uniref:hypothetical protein n=1 Tax=Streptomyces sp. NPDC059564 TaxID=3346865 RepID=UPI0036CF7DFE
MSDEQPHPPPRSAEWFSPVHENHQGHDNPQPLDPPADVLPGTAAASGLPTNLPALVPALPAPGPNTGPASITVNHPEMVVGTIHTMNVETRKRDILEGPTLQRHRITKEPLVRKGQWTEAWRQALDLDERRLRRHVLIIVAPRSFGSTTLALHLLARHTDDQTDIVKLDADWKVPKVGRLPAENQHAYQLDLKDPDRDRVSADFLKGLEQHAELLESLDSYLVLNVAKDLWVDHYLPSQAGIHVVHLNAPPPAQEVVEAHLQDRDVPGLVPYLHSIDRTKVSLNGLDAVEAVRAADSVVLAWQEHTRLTGSALSVDDPSWSALDAGLTARITAALSDWRDKLDILFGESVVTHVGKETSLPVEDRCLLLALAVHQSAPMPDVAKAARSLQDIISTDDAGKSGFASTAGAVFAGRGLRRRIVDAGAAVDTHDGVVFDQPGYGRAVLTYVWDNYEVMRDPLLKWLMAADGSADANERVVDAIVTLTLRHGTALPFTQLGSLARTAKKGLLSAVMARAVLDEHAGRHAWATLYGWASAQEHATAVVTTCRRVLHSADVTSSQARMAMVRLRRVANTARDEAIQAEVFRAFEELARRSDGVARLVAEVHTWQQSGRSGRAGAAAFLTLMSVPNGTTPWLLSQEAPSEVDVERTLQALLGDVITAPDVIDRLTEWIKRSAADPASYALIRNRLVPALRGQKMFKASMDLMQALAGIPLGEDTNAAEDFWGRLVDSRVRSVFPLERTPA